MDFNFPPNWRLIVSPSLSGAENMAIDEALLHSFKPGLSRPVLRIYGWEPAALSLGRFQKAAEILDLERCKRDGVAVVRRITGGGVIYHADELTYSLVCAPEQIPPAESVKDSFRVLTGFLLAFYRLLGLNPDYAVDVSPIGTRLGERTDFCFAGRESFDIIINDSKIGGNAQRRQRGIIFQHGSIPILNRAETGLSYLLDHKAGESLTNTSLADCGITCDPKQLRQKLQTAFEGHFGVTTAAGLNENESEFAHSLLKGKYLMQSWNMEGVVA